MPRAADRILTEEELAKVSAGYDGSKLTSAEKEEHDRLLKQMKQAVFDYGAGKISFDEYFAATSAMARFIDRMNAKYGPEPSAY